MPCPRSLQVGCDLKTVADTWACNEVVVQPACTLVAGERAVVGCDHPGLDVPEDVRVLFELLWFAVPVSCNDEL
eukprot:12200389-Heterocapsa_arctica.AAC.1